MFYLALCDKMHLAKDLLTSLLYGAKRPAAAQGDRSPLGQRKGQGPAQNGCTQAGYRLAFDIFRMRRDVRSALWLMQRLLTSALLPVEPDTCNEFLAALGAEPRTCLHAMHAMASEPWFAPNAVTLHCGARVCRSREEVSWVLQVVTTPGLSPRADGLRVMPQRERQDLAIAAFRVAAVLGEAHVRWCARTCDTAWGLHVPPAVTLSATDAWL